MLNSIIRREPLTTSYMIELPGVERCSKILDKKLFVKKTVEESGAVKYDHCFSVSRCQKRRGIC